MDYKDKVIELIKSKELTSEQVTKLEEIFPELKESEDERIREGLIRCVKGNMPDNDFRKKYIAWLEKQGEQNLTNSAKTCKDEQKPKFKVGDTIKCKYDDRQFTIKSIDLDEGTYTYTQEGCGNDIDYADKEFELVEQKPVDKVEPKFKNGQWIVWQNKCYKVNYNGCGYELIDQNGLSTSLEYVTVDENVHLWTIQDAKEGDVLSNWNNTTFIFKAIEDETVKFHIAYNEKWDEIKTPLTKLSHLGLPEPQFEFHPATKEQRDALEKAMADAGYTFDFEKKELKKIEQTAWSKEDEAKLKSILFHIEDVENKDVIDWLKSIKDRVLPQPRQEWSEEDKKIKDKIMHSLIYNVQLKVEDMLDINDWFNSLKSLRPQKYVGYNPYKVTVESIAKMCNKYENLMWDETEAKDFLCEISTKCREAAEYEKKYPQKQWKPSDEQMEELHKAIVTTGFNPNVLESLYNDLKNLKQ